MNKNKRAYRIIITIPVFIGFSLLLMVTGCNVFSPNTQEQSRSDNGSGSAIISVQVGKIGVLAKKQAIDLARLVLTLSSPGEDTVRDTTSLSGTGSIDVQVAFGDLKAPRIWKVDAATVDGNDSCIHEGSATFTTTPADTADVSLVLNARFSMFRVSFNGIPDSAVTLSISLDGGAIEMDSIITAGSLDTVALSYDYLKADTAGVGHTVSLRASGVYFSKDTVLYAADTTISVVSGENRVHDITCKWVGPEISIPIVTAMKNTTVDIGDTLSISATATSDQGEIGGFVWALNGSDYEDTTKTGTISHVFATEGKYTVYVRAFNSFGIYSMPDSVVISVGAAVPKVSFLDDSYTINTYVDSTLQITVQASDADGSVEKYLWSLDNKDFIYTTDTATSNLRVTGSGTSILYVKVLDNDSLFSEIDSCIVNIIWKKPEGEIAYDTSIVDSIVDFGQMKKYQFNGTAGEHVTIRMQSYGNNYFDSKFELYTPAGAIDTSDWDRRAGYGIDQANIIDYTLKTTGTYTIYVSELDGDNTSKYWLSLQCKEHLKANAKPITYDFYEADSIHVGGKMRGYTFSGTAGEHVTIRMQSYGNNYFDSKFELYTPAGAIDTSDWDRRAGYGIDQANIIDYTLKATGTYTIYVSELDGDNTSKYWLSLQCKEQLTSASIPISYGITVSDSIMPSGDIDAFSFDGTEGDLITLRLQSVGNNYFDSKFELYTPAGAIDTSDWDRNAGYGIDQANIIDYTLKTTGTYTIFVSELQGDHTSNYWMSLQAK